MSKILFVYWQYNKINMARSYLIKIVSPNTNHHPRDLERLVEKALYSEDENIVSVKVIEYNKL